MSTGCPCYWQTSPVPFPAAIIAPAYIQQSYFPLSWPRTSVNDYKCDVKAAPPSRRPSSGLPSNIARTLYHVSLARRPTQTANRHAASVCHSRLARFWHQSVMSLHKKSLPVIHAGSPPPMHPRCNGTDAIALKGSTSFPTCSAFPLYH